MNEVTADIEFVRYGYKDDDFMKNRMTFVYNWTCTIWQIDAKVFIAKDGHVLHLN